MSTTRAPGSELLDARAPEVVAPLDARVPVLVSQLEANAPEILSQLEANAPELVSPTADGSAGFGGSAPSSGLDALVHATLYEGFALYPYRPSALKNQRRFAFGAIYPRWWAERTLDPNLLRTEVLVTAAPGATPILRVCVRFLRLARGGGGREHRIELLPLALTTQLGAAAELESRAALESRTECFIPATDELPALEIEVETSAARIDRETWRYAIEIKNITELVAMDPLNGLRAHVGTRAAEQTANAAGGKIEPAAGSIDATASLDGETAMPPLDHEAAMDVTASSVHVVLRVAGGAFVSAIDPPDELRAASAACRSTGLFPILAGEGAMLASPIILPDHPEIAPQSPGDFFDGTEMDEMLTLRVLTMTDDEKREASTADPRIAALIARTEELGIEATARLHGVVRGASVSGASVAGASVAGASVSGASKPTRWPMRGARVRIHPSRSADAFDLLLAGRLATVVVVERDFEGVVHCAVTIDDDPGADLGEVGMPGHRFYFRAEELEVIT